MNPCGSLSQATPSSDLAINQPVIADTSLAESGNTRGNVSENEIGPGWKIAFDNLDIFQRVREMTEDNKNKDHH